MTSVRVQLWIGEATYARSVADVFESDVLTITPVDGGPASTHQAGAWKHATVYDELGYPCALYRALTPTRAVRSEEDR